MRKYNDVLKINKDIAVLRLTKGKTTIIDREDYEKIKSYKWVASQYDNNGSVRVEARIKNGNNKNIRLHRLIMGIDKSDIVIDHINRDALDNRKSNLRVCTPKQNKKNISMHKRNKCGYKGLTLLKSNKYYVQITHNCKNNYIGTFNNKTIAAVAYDVAALKYHGEFANLNFPRENYNSLNI